MSLLKPKPKCMGKYKEKDRGSFNVNPCINCNYIGECLRKSGARKVRK